MKTILYNFFVDIPQAAAIWTALVLVATIAMAVMIVLPRRKRPGDELELSEAEQRRKLLVDRARQSARYADEVSVAAERATVTAARRREEWLAAQEQVEVAWQAYDEADLVARRLAPGSSLPTPRTPHTPAEYADRERYLHRAAMAACCRRELSVLELSDVLANRNGWDPRRHPVEQELVLRRTVRDRLFVAYHGAQERERAAWQAAELAAVAARSLREEAFAAAGQAHRLHPWLEPEAPESQETQEIQYVAGIARQPRPTVRWRTARAG